jgi:ATP-binding cassette subfamily B (MDR/TAP) protein 1
MTLQATLLEMAAMATTNNLKTKWFRALLRQDMAFYDLRDISGTATLVSSNAITFRRGVGKKLGDGVQFFFTIILGLAYGFWSSWQISLFILAVVPFMAASAMLLTKLVTTQTKRANSSYAKAGSIVYTSVSAIRTILSLNAVESMVSRFMAATEEAYDGATKQVMQLGFADGCMMASFLLSYIPVALYGSYLLYTDVLETGCDPSGSSLDNPECEPVTAAGVFGAMFGVSFAGSVMPQITASYEAFMGAQSAAYPALEAIYRETSTDKEKKAELDEKSQALQRRGSSALLPKYTIDSMSPDGKKPGTVDGEIEFRDVHFAYPSRLEVEVFRGLSLKVPAGKTVALVGASGGGKSTTVHLLERFYDVRSGVITLDGVDLRTLNIKWLRQQIGLVSQEPKLFAQSIRDNIAIGLPGATQKQIEEAAREANAHDFIMSFPSGYATQVGDEGSQMSGGQKQRIAIARVLIKKPKLLLLDEATSALDSESEAVVQEALDVLMQEGNQTVIVIAHRLSTVRKADIIAVVSEGRVVETGSHDELMEKDSAYAELVAAQTRSKVDKKEEGTTITSSASSQTSSNPPSRSGSFVGEPSELLNEAIGDTVEVEVDIGVVGEAVPVLRFHDAHFHYPSRPQNKIFRGLNLAVRKGETLAIVGPSGQGKSTLIQLIETFYRPTKGSLEFQGVDMETLNVRWIRDQLSLVSQEPVLFDSTIGENIRFGSPGASQAEVEWAAREANAHDFIMAFPDGYDTQVGAGSSLHVSGGQKQRIAIARALLRKPKVLLLDEATSGTSCRQFVDSIVCV